MPGRSNSTSFQEAEKTVSYSSATSGPGSNAEPDGASPAGLATAAAGKCGEGLGISAESGVADSAFSAAGVIVVVESFMSARLRLFEALHRRAFRRDRWDRRSGGPLYASPPPGSRSRASHGSSMPPTCPTQRLPGEQGPAAPKNDTSSPVSGEILSSKNKTKIINIETNHPTPKDKQQFLEKNCS